LIGEWEASDDLFHSIIPIFRIGSGERLGHGKHSRALHTSISSMVAIIPFLRALCQAIVA